MNSPVAPVPSRHPTKSASILFLESIPGLLTFDEFMPKQRGEVLALRPRQEEALSALDRLRLCEFDPRMTTGRDGILGRHVG